MRTPKKVGDDVVRAMRRCLVLEKELLEAHLARDIQKAEATRLALSHAIKRSEKLVDEFCEKVSAASAPAWQPKKQSPRAPTTFGRLKRV